MSDLAQRIALLRERLAALGDPPGVLPEGEALRNRGTVRAMYPPSLLTFYGLTYAPRCGLINFHSEGNFGEQPFLGADRKPIETDEVWLRFGVSGTERIVVDMNSDRVALYDPYYYRYGEPSPLRIVAPDVLTFVDKCLYARPYADVVRLDPDNPNDGDGWLTFLQGVPA